jgi:hypothetical protein
MPLLDAVVRAWRESTFAPGRFFPVLGRDQGIGVGVLYYLALGILVEGITLFWRMVLPLEQQSAGRLAALLALGPAPTPLASFLFSPLTLLFSLFVVAAVVHVLLLVFGGAHRGFGTTVRVLCFAYSPQIFAIVPIAGALVGGVWMVVLAIVGLAAAHETSRWRSALAVLVPLLVGVLFMAVAALVLGIGRTLG